MSRPASTCSCTTTESDNPVLADDPGQHMRLTELGRAYQQEYYKGEGEVVTVGKEQVEVPFGFFDGVPS